MGDIGAQLSAELTRIIECPYPASLSHLADLLSRAENLTIRACIRERPPCAVSRLATIVCEALPLWAYGLDILTCLCQSPEFRDTVLLQSAALLDALLSKADSKQRDFDTYAGLCVLLLSRPLPVSTPLPASAQAFFLRVFEHAVRSPDVSTLRPIYFMLNGACRNVLNVLPAERQRQFDEDLSVILSSNNAGQNQMLLLWCFGIALLAEYPDGRYETHAGRTERRADISEQSSEKQWKTSSYRRLFGSASKVNKTIQMTYMSVIWATKDDVGISDEDAIEGIRIAVRTLRVVDRRALEAWPRSSAIARNTVAKLTDKVLRTNMDPVMQIEALAFYATIAGGGNIPHEIVAQYERCLSSITRLADVECYATALCTSLPSFAPRLQKSSVQLLLNDILDVCILPSDTHKLSQYIALVEQIAATLPTCDHFQSMLLSAVSALELQDKVWKMMQTTSESGSGMCCAHAVSLHRKIIQATIALLLNIALGAQHQTPTFPRAVASALITKQASFSHLATHCSHKYPVPNATRVSLFQQNNTPYTGQHLQNWRDRLNSELESQGHYQRDSIIRSVAQICQDLESRCDSVEEPLRQERRRTEDLERQVNMLNARIVSLEVEATDDRLHLEGLEDEKLNIADERDSLAAKFRELQEEVEEASRRVDDALNGAHEEFNSKEMELRSTILSQEETLQARTREMEAQNEVIRGLRADLGDAQNHHTLLVEQHETLRQRLAWTEHKLNGESEANRIRSEELATSRDRNVELELQLQGIEAELEAVTARLSDLQVSHQELIHSSEEAYKELETKYTNDMESAARKEQEATERLGAELRETVQRAQTAEEAHSKIAQDLRQVQASVPPLEDRIQELNDFCTEQEEELEELRTMRRNLLAGLGVASQHPLAIRSASRTQDEAVERTPRVSREHRRRKSAIQTLQGVTNTAMETVANASFGSSDSLSSQNRPTPKRSKPRPSFKVPSMHTPYMQKPALAARSVSKKLSASKRSALRQLSPNRRHTTVGFAASENEDEYDNAVRSARKRRGSLDGVGEADFDMDDFLAGTPLTPGNFASGTGRIPDGDDDATATEL